MQKKFHEIAEEYLGVREGGETHKALVDYYNANCAGGYKLSVKDPWCAAFVSVILVMGGAVNPPLECSCQRMKAKCQKNGQLLPDVQGVQVDDIIFYDWDRNGFLDHVGFVSAVSGKHVKVIEGNKSDSVGYREISIGSVSVDSIARVSQSETAGKREVTDALVSDIIRGKYGNGAARRRKLEKMGYNYLDVQNEVNKRMLGGWRS